MPRRSTDEPGRLTRMTNRDGTGEFGKALSRAARRERPSDEARRRALAGALGQIGAGAHVDESLEERTDGAGGRPGARDVRFGRRAAYGVAAALAMAATVGAVLVVERERGDVVSISPSPEKAAPKPATNPALDVQPGERAAAPLTEMPKSAQAHRVKLVSGRDAGTTARAPSLDEEVNALDDARTALASGKSREALERLGRYHKVLHGTRLAAEATLLEIQALAESGRRDEAAKMARHFIDGNPGNPLVDRARAFVVVPSDSSNGIGVRTGGSSP